MHQCFLLVGVSPRGIGTSVFRYIWSPYTVQGDIGAYLFFSAYIMCIYIYAHRMGWYHRNTSQLLVQHTCASTTTTFTVLSPIILLFERVSLWYIDCDICMCIYIYEDGYYKTRRRGSETYTRTYAGGICSESLVRLQKWIVRVLNVLPDTLLLIWLPKLFEVTSILVSTLPWKQGSACICAYMSQSPSYGSYNNRLHIYQTKKSFLKNTKQYIYQTVYIY